MKTLLITVHDIVCIIIICIVLLQVGRGAEAGAMFGGSGQAQQSRGQSTFMGKFTTVMAVAFMLTSFFLTYDTSNKAKSSVTEIISEEQQQSTPLVTDSSEETTVPATDEAAAD